MTLTLKVKVRSRSKFSKILWNVDGDFSAVFRQICTKLAEWSHNSDVKMLFFPIFDILIMTLKKGHFTIYGHMSITLELSTIEM